MHDKNNSEKQENQKPHDLVQINEKAFKSDSCVSHETLKAPHKCVYCGVPSWVHPCDQVPPPDYCHESDHGAPDPRLIHGTREHVEMVLDSAARYNLTMTIKACRLLERGSYFVTIKDDREYNEITVKLWESCGSAKTKIASASIDKGHTAASRLEATEDVRSTIRAYLCR